MSDTLRDDLLALLDDQLPDRPVDRFQLATDLNRHRVWLEYDRPGLLLMLAHPEAPVGAGTPDFIVQGPGKPVMLLFDSWFRDHPVKALFAAPCLGEKADILASCDCFLLRCTTAYRTVE